MDHLYRAASDPESSSGTYLPSTKPIHAFDIQGVHPTTNAALATISPEQYLHYFSPHAYHLQLASLSAMYNGSMHMHATQSFQPSASAQSAHQSQTLTPGGNNPYLAYLDNLIAQRRRSEEMFNHQLPMVGGGAPLQHTGGVGADVAGMANRMMAANGNFINLTGTHGKNGMGAARQRTAQACECCRKRKTKCTGTSPCERCKNRKLQCIYANGMDNLPRGPLKAREELRARPVQADVHPPVHMHNLAHAAHHLPASLIMGDNTMHGASQVMSPLNLSYSSTLPPTSLSRDNIIHAPVPIPGSVGVLEKYRDHASFPEVSSSCPSSASSSQLSGLPTPPPTSAGGTEADDVEGRFKPSATITNFAEARAQEEKPLGAGLNHTATVAPSMMEPSSPSSADPLSPTSLPDLQYPDSTPSTSSEPSSIPSPFSLPPLLDGEDVPWPIEDEPAFDFASNDEYLTGFGMCSESSMGPSGMAPTNAELRRSLSFNHKVASPGGFSGAGFGETAMGLMESESATFLGQLLNDDILNGFDEDEVAVR